ncbi:5-formyltetrahydrofolate cyclo-ligase [Schaalia turicensis ACS-279-V-Col4]|uniref:5-formyltetrahydrofolate cyclo-ligase n=1 Tax=Schaalia turicensis ACS-279-V-Col4 TaxID=883077 RepID=K0Z4T2_9ACTO|nr:5-formyltetrahydrofolate cyclo-ligase [Schaalia turicensis ACS-279-V-Col4]
MIHEDKALIRARIRTQRSQRRVCTSADQRARERAQLAALWPEVLADFGFSSASVSSAPVDETALTSVSSPPAQGASFLPALFISSPSEPDTAGLLQACEWCLIPGLVDPDGKAAIGVAWTYVDSRPQTAEPMEAKLESIVSTGPRFTPTCIESADELAKADLIVVPALAVDARGVRLGQGGGWYDRALEHARPGVPIIAVVFDNEFFSDPRDYLPVEPHDQRVNGVLTPSGYTRLIHNSR